MDLVIRNAKVWTVDERRPRAEAVAVRDARIVAVGDDREVRDAVAGAEELDAGGNTVLPGFIDAHNHLRTGADADAVQLGDATTLDSVRSAIDGYATEHPDREWIVAEDWSYAALPGRRRPTAEDLEGVAPGRALMVFSYDVHNVWLNREAMRRFGIGAPERSLAFGRPEIDAGTGEPTGFVTDFAVMGLSRDGQAALAEQVPNFAPDEMYRRLLRSLDMAAELGITTAVEPQNSVDDLPLFRRARDEGAMRSRVIAALFHPPGTTSAELGVVACMQPRHCAPRIVQDWRANVGSARWRYAWPFRSLIEHGATLAFSSDWNVAEMDPFVWLFTARTRANLDGSEPWTPEETIDPPAAIRAATIGSAYANFGEGDRGSIEVGKLGDLIVLSRDVFVDEPAALLETSVDTTIVGGDVVFRR